MVEDYPAFLKFADDFLIAAYLNQPEESDEWAFSDILLKGYVGRREPDWIKLTLEALFRAGLADDRDWFNRSDDNEADRYLVKLMHAGKEWARMLILLRASDVLKHTLSYQNGDKIFDELRREIAKLSINDSLQLTDTLSMPVDSSTWTGLARGTADARDSVRLVAMIDLAMDGISGADVSNQQAIQAVAYLRAARELAQAPELDSELIWQILGKAADIIGVLGFFFALFLSSQ